jgi:molybdopterin-synthase adenylyltransferase
MRSTELASNRVLIVGVGGIGVPAAIALMRGGVRDLVLIDPDDIELSNLPRQILFDEQDIGQPKAMVAARRLGQRYPDARLETDRAEFDECNGARLIAECDFVIDATDNPRAKFLINDRCVAAGRAFVYAGVLGTGGQAMTILPGRTACLRCLFEEPPDEAEIASCREAGIIGPVAGAIGEAAAAEAIRAFRGAMPALAGTMLTYDAKAPGRTRLTAIAARAGCACGAASAAREAGFK